MRYSDLGFNGKEFIRVARDLVKLCPGTVGTMHADWSYRVVGLTKMWPKYTVKNGDAGSS